MRLAYGEGMRKSKESFNRPVIVMFDSLNNTLGVVLNFSMLHQQNRQEIDCGESQKVSGLQEEYAGQK